MRALLVLPALQLLFGDDRTSLSKSLESAGGFQLPQNVSLDQPLTQSQAVAVAFWNNTALEAELRVLEIARADLVEAGQLRNPLIQILFPVGPKPFELLLTAPIELLWQRPSRVRMARVNLQKVGQTLAQKGLDLARDVKLAHAELAWAQDQSRIGAAAAALHQRIAELSKRRVAVGDAARAEIQQALLDAERWSHQSIEWRDRIRVSTERLRLLLGLKNAARQIAIAADPAAPPPIAALLSEIALSFRPDLKAMELEIESLRHRAGWERSKVWTIAPGLSTKGVGTSGIRTGPAVAADIPVLNRNKGAIARAEAELRQVAAAWQAAKDAVDSEVRLASLQWSESWESLRRIQQQILPSARETVQQVESRFTAGDISRLEVLDAQRSLIDLQIREAEASANCRRAKAALERAVGKQL